MKNEVLLKLENRVEAAVKLIHDLRTEKENLDRDNKSLKLKLENLLKKIEELKSEQKNVSSKLAAAKSDSAGLEIKKRLRKLAGKLAALEDSWN